MPKFITIECFWESGKEREVTIDSENVRGFDISPSENDTYYPDKPPYCLHITAEPQKYSEDLYFQTKEDAQKARDSLT